MLTKSQLRTHFRSVREQIPPKQKLDAATHAANLFNKQFLKNTSFKIACYLATPEEFETLFIIKKILLANHACYLPWVDTNSKEMKFILYDIGDVLQPNQYSILEPMNHSQTIAPKDLDIVLLPLVAYDLQGNRLGMGAGYYDKALAFLKESTQKSPLILGIGYEAQLAENIPADPWDVKLHGVLTEKEIKRFL